VTALGWGLAWLGAALLAALGLGRVIRIADEKHKAQVRAVSTNDPEPLLGVVPPPRRDAG